MSRSQTHLTIHEKAFTLVELIVIMTVLSILATIAFVSFSGQSSRARDSARLTDLSNIFKGLGVSAAMGSSYPLPESNIRIYSGSAQIGYQGIVGADTLKIIRFSADRGKDPLDSEAFYTYSTNIAKNKAQLLGFLENLGSANIGFNPFDDYGGAFAISYNDRYPYEVGDNLGILLVQSGSSLSPLQDVLVPGSTFDTGGSAIVTGNVVVIDNSSMQLPDYSNVIFDGFTSTGNTYVSGSLSLPSGGSGCIFDSSRFDQCLFD